MTQWESYQHQFSESRLDKWHAKPPKKMSYGDKVSYFSPLMGYILNSEFSGPYLMIFSFIFSYFIGVACVKKYCRTVYGFRTFAQEVKMARRRDRLSLGDNSDGGFSYGEFSESAGYSGPYSDNRSESGTSTYSAMDTTYEEQEPPRQIQFSDNRPNASLLDSDMTRNNF